MPSQQLWRKSGHRPIKPPLYHKQSGRPKKARTRPVDEIPKGATKLRRYGIVIHCSVCGGEGHNATNCGRAYGNMGRGRGRGRGKGRGTSSVYQSEEEQVIRGGLTRTAATASRRAPTNVASQPAPCNVVSQAGPSNVTQNTSRPQGKRFKSIAKRARPWR
ncbi:hypothetical protein L3X38_027066 [Prunus dulcis]|uniref:CCHC-type domain-containing protein n=1 Tax=Prunus dulcis TaxID=3755 RepID=A0AAD4Z002_PRUDU|nr:hypothetical protein L3X38_027066 [Prunus dulcis]